MISSEFFEKKKKKKSLFMLERGIAQIYHVWEGYFQKIPVKRRKISQANQRGKFSLKTGIFLKYPSQYDISV